VQEAEGIWLSFPFCTSVDLRGAHKQARCAAVHASERPVIAGLNVSALGSRPKVKRLTMVPSLAQHPNEGRVERFPANDPHSTGGDSQLRSQGTL
jgi:hypothetical protein